MFLHFYEIKPISFIYTLFSAANRIAVQVVEEIQTAADQHALHQAQAIDNVHT